jgi:hypothetical protein
MSGNMKRTVSEDSDRDGPSSANNKRRRVGSSAVVDRDAIANNDGQYHVDAIRSLRQQALEKTWERFQEDLRIAEAKEGMDCAGCIYWTVCTYDRELRRISKMYPERDSLRVMAMGSDEANALGLTTDPDEDKEDYYRPTLIK